MAVIGPGDSAGVSDHVTLYHVLDTIKILSISWGLTHIADGHKSAS